MAGTELGGAGNNCGAGGHTPLGHHAASRLLVAHHVALCFAENPTNVGFSAA